MTSFKWITALIGIIAAAAMPIAIEKIIIDNEKYSYLLDKYYYTQAIFISAFVILIFSTIPLIIYFLKILTSTLIYSNYKIFLSKKYQFSIIYIVIAALTLGLISFGHGIKVYTYSIYREYKYFDNIRRQKLIENANKFAERPDRQIEHLKYIVAEYPEDRRNELAKERIIEVETVIDMSNLLRKIANEKFSEENYVLSLEYTRHSLSFWRFNEGSKQIQQKLLQVALDSESVIQQHYNNCKNRRFDKFDGLETLSGLIFRDATLLRPLYAKAKDSKEISDFLHSQLCSMTETFPSPSAFSEDLAETYRVSES
ncbi:hypothetical protein [uncultured Roseibium sp.]|uniref:hypothetical protein n=1 Tax=uncultured Roseibium sp. TaxID=1936171 RepID=UPI002593EF08|nr:hypothetical protein [uncultured Roseibium sp.]